MAARQTCALLWLLVAASAPLCAQSAAPKMRVDDAWARRASMLATTDPRLGTGNGAAYAKLVNAGKEPDALVAVASDVAASVEIHESYQEAGLMKMRAVDAIGVAPGATVELKPGGYHIMLINLKRDLKPGATIDMTLQFRNAGKIPVAAVIK